MALLWHYCDPYAVCAHTIETLAHTSLAEWFAPLLLNKTFPRRVGKGGHGLKLTPGDASAATGHTSMREWVNTSNPFDTVAALLYRPSRLLSAIVERIGRSRLPPHRTVTLHIRAEIMFANLSPSNATAKPELHEAVVRRVLACAQRMARARQLDHLFISSDSIARPIVHRVAASIASPELRILTRRAVGEPYRRVVVSWKRSCSLTDAQCASCKSETHCADAQ